MQMEFYRGLYISETLERQKERIIRKLKKNQFQPNLYILVLAQGKQNHLEFFSALLLKQHIFENMPLFIVGIADGYDEAVSLVVEITKEVYQKTKGCDLREYILKNQRESGEGSV